MLCNGADHAMPRAEIVFKVHKVGFCLYFFKSITNLRRNKMIKNKEITSRDENFADWFTNIVQKAGITDYSGVKGFFILAPNGYAIWEQIQNVLDKEFKKTGHKNIYMPLLIPEKLLQKEAEHIEGFAPEVAWVTHGGNQKLDDRLCVRPTSETLFCDYYSKCVKSYRDLPKLYNQWCSVVRWEKETRPLFRGREFLWQEGHTVHASAEEAEAETRQMLDIYTKFFYDYLAIPVIVGQKTEKEKFAGAEYTFTCEALMYNGVSLQSATSHYFGQKFAKQFDMKFLNKDNKLEYMFQTSWGISIRTLAALIAVHADDNGLVLPPKIAPTKAVIIPIGKDDKVLAKCQEIASIFKEKDMPYILDDSDKSPGFKFNQYEMEGIPVRIEVGPRDLENNELTIARRDTNEKIKISLNDNIYEKTQQLLDDIQRSLLKKATERRDKMTYVAKNMKDIEEIITKHPGFIKAMWCGDQKCEEEIKKINGTKSRCIPFKEEKVSDTCVCCGKKAKKMVIWGLQY